MLQSWPEISNKYYFNGFGLMINSLCPDRPRFTTPVNSTTPVIEGSSLSIQCSATANPMPNVTWVRIMERPTFISAGVGEAFLRFNNITIQQGGTYECQATNNPNELPVTVEIEISVKCNYFRGKQCSWAGFSSYSKTSHTPILLLYVSFKIQGKTFIPRAGGGFDYQQGSAGLNSNTVPGWFLNRFDFTGSGFH